MRLIFLLSFILGGPVARAETLRVGFEESGFPPFYFKEAAKKPGIYDRILQEVQTTTGDTYKIEYWPQARKLRLFEAGALDVEPGVNPEWREKYNDISAYSASYAEMEDVLIAPLDAAAPFRSPEELVGKRLGTITANVYPQFEALFKDGRVARDDSDDEPSMLRKLSKHRVDAGILWRTVAEYYQRADGVNRFAIGGSVDTKSIHFRFQSKKKAALERFNQALQGLKSSGKLKEIFDEFR